MNNPYQVKPLHIDLKHLGLDPKREKKLEESIRKNEQKRQRKIDKKFDIYREDKSED